MAAIADILLVAGAIAAGFYCWVLGRRLRRFSDLEKGVGGAVAVLSAQVDDLSKALDKARSAASASVAALDDANMRAELTAQRLELMMASTHDMPNQSVTPAPENPFFVRSPNGNESAQ